MCCADASSRTHKYKYAHALAVRFCPIYIYIRIEVGRGIRFNAPHQLCMASEKTNASNMQMLSIKKTFAGQSDLKRNLIELQTRQSFAPALIVHSCMQSVTGCGLAFCTTTALLFLPKLRVHSRRARHLSSLNRRLFCARARCIEIEI